MHALLTMKTVIPRDSGRNFPGDEYQGDKRSCLINVVKGE